MKLKKQSETEWFGRFDEGEDINEAIKKFCKENKIETGWFWIVGSVKNSSIAFYDQENKKYLVMDLEEPAEILHCSGNISFRDGEIIVHTHAVLGDIKGQAYGGHLMSAKVFAAEIYLKKFENVVNRKLNNKTKLSQLEP